MTSDDLDVIFSLVVVPGQETPGSPEDVLRHFGTDDGRGLGLRLLREAADASNAVDLEAALLLCQTFGLGVQHLQLLIELVPADWHQQHENIVTMLGGLRTPEAVGALQHAATWVPDYLEYDENRALATKAIWALGGTPGAGAERALAQLRESDDEVVREEAQAQLRRR